MCFRNTLKSSRCNMGSVRAGEAPPHATEAKWLLGYSDGHPRSILMPHTNCLPGRGAQARAQNAPSQTDVSPPRVRQRRRKALKCSRTKIFKKFAHDNDLDRDNDLTEPSSLPYH